MSSFDTAQAATNREQARRPDGKFGEQPYTRSGIDLDTPTTGPHPAGEPETNPALAHLQPPPWCGTTRWCLDTDDAARYAESIDSNGARRLVQTCQVGAGPDRGDEFRADARGCFDAFLEPDGKTLGPEGEGDTYLLEADGDTLRLLNAERNQYGERAENAGVAVSEVDIDATTGTIRSMSVACDLQGAGVTHQADWSYQLWRLRVPQRSRRRCPRFRATNAARPRCQGVARSASATWCRMVTTLGMTVSRSCSYSVGCPPADTEMPTSNRSSDGGS